MVGSSSSTNVSSSVSEPASPKGGHGLELENVTFARVDGLREIGCRPGGRMRAPSGVMRDQSDEDPDLGYRGRP